MDRLSRAGSLEPIGELRLSLAGVTGPLQRLGRVEHAAERARASETRHR